jgi:hypothetical protein
VTVGQKYAREGGMCQHKRSSMQEVNDGAVYKIACFFAFSPRLSPGALRNRSRNEFSHHVISEVGNNIQAVTPLVLTYLHVVKCVCNGHSVG